MPVHISYFGIRHHGPGSAVALVKALEELRPAHVLIEGPSDATEMLIDLASVDMKPPIALLAFPTGEPELTGFWPYAEFSPEYQAVCWAFANGASVSFIDLPSVVVFEEKTRLKSEVSQEETVTDDEDKETPGFGSEKSQASEKPNIKRIDSISLLAEAAGYQDGESWWADFVEQNREPGPIFEAIGRAMTEVRAVEHDESDAYEARREAYMRLAITETAKKAEGPVAVVCGAWHVPALQTKKSLTKDKATVGSISRKKATITWAPWTMPRLTFAGGYGAGVAAPGWCQHIWDSRERQDGPSLWLTRIAHVLRKKGHQISTASLIEAQRLALALASLRERPQPGFEELREACVACLFDGEPLLWNLIEEELLLGNRVGSIPSNVLLAPLIVDLQTQARKARLKMEALERELSLDLRSESGLFRSTLLHRLSILGVPWGKLTDAGRSRGTFREKWVLAFEPEFNVELVTKLVYGSSIEQAATGVISESFTKAASLNELATGVDLALTAALPQATLTGLKLLEHRAALTCDCEDILATLPPIANIVRYGQARATDVESMANLACQLIIEASINLVYSARGLDADAASHLGGLIAAADAGIRLIQPSDDVLSSWTRGLGRVLEDSQASPFVAGGVASLLYEAEILASSEVVDMLAVRLSSGTPVVDAASFFEGFFQICARRLLYDEGLRQAVDQWLVELTDENYTAYLPLLRRVFSSLDKMERKRLLAAVFGEKQAMPSGMVLVPDLSGWENHLAVLKKLLMNGITDEH